MTLSKTAIRPHQTQYLLRKGFLPVSIDFRRCPEVNLIEGPITDVRDAYAWVKQDLPLLARQSRHSLMIDADKVVVVGWSIGGFLAMTPAWTCKEITVAPPTAILSFYGPTTLASHGISPPSNERFLRTRQLMKVVEHEDSEPESASQQTQTFQKALDKLRLSLSLKPV